MAKCPNVLRMQRHIYTYWIMRNKNCTHMHHLWKMQKNALTHCGYSFKKITLWKHLVLISYKYISSYRHIHVFVMFKQFRWPLMSPSSVVEWFTTRCHNGEQRVICVTELVHPSSLFMGAFSFRMHIASFMSLALLFESLSIQNCLTLQIHECVGKN